MARTPGRAREEFLNSNKNYQYAPLDYFTNARGVRRRRDAHPFFLEMVEKQGKEYKTVAIPFPPQDEAYAGSNPNRKYIAGIKLLVNPASLSVNMSKIINRTQTMTGWVEDHWGEEVDTVTLQGSTAAFVTGAPNIGGLGPNVRAHTKGLQSFSEEAAQSRADLYSNLGLLDASVPYQTSDPYSKIRKSLFLEPGLTTVFRRQSLSYKEFRRIIEFFTANGCIYDRQGFVRDRKRIVLTYDYSSYIGYFESLDIIEDALMPYRFTYTATFKAEKTNYSFVTRKGVNGQATGTR